MAGSFFCYACGHNLNHIPDKRLKCYGCERYFVDSFGETLCRCRKRAAFKYSVEIIAPNKGKCICCGKEFKVEGNLEPPQRDKHRGVETDSNFSVVPFQPVHSKKPILSKKTLQEAIRKIVFEPDVLDENDKFLIVGELPFHQKVEEISLEIKDGILTLKSLISGIDFEKIFTFPADVIGETLAVTLKNSILEIRFQKKQNRT